MFQNPGYIFFPPTGKSQKIEVNYIKPLKAIKPGAQKPGLSRNEPFLKLPAKISLDKRIPPPFVNREEASKTAQQAMRKEFIFDKPAGLLKPDTIAITKKITLPAVALEKIANPSYISYYQVVREKIRRSAYQNYNRNETGEVYISFIISDAGYLKGVRLVEEKSQATPYLKNIALASVKNASPFPRFPKELDYSQLSFNVVISFEVE
ncbi:MAG: TonB family protein [Candidatus Omnitrophota bacterium]